MSETLARGSIARAEAAGAEGEPTKALATGVARAVENLLSIQYPEGYWWGELESNPTMEAEYLLLTHFWGVADRARWRKISNYILSKQREDGSWGQYYGGPGDVSTSVECYFALKLAGVPADSDAMTRARKFILSRGGVPRVRVFTKIWLALFGQWPWKGVPVLPPELMHIPTFLPFNIYDFSSWARGTIVPLSIVMSYRPVCPIPESAVIDELYPVPKEQVDFSVPHPKHLAGWAGLFYYADKLLHRYGRLPWQPGRASAIRKAEHWLVAHQEADGSWGGIQPPWVYSLVALKVLGHTLDHPVVKKGLEGFEAFAIEEGDTWRVQACISPVWDTCLAAIALRDAGLPPEHLALAKAGGWLVKEQILTGGDWQVKAKGVEPGGWAFEFENDIYPDIDDAAEVIIALDLLRLPDEEARSMAIERGVRWLLAMQSRNGGWGAFDKDNDSTYVARIPFADFGEMLDPPSVDVTAHIVECLGRLGYAQEHPSVRKALRYIRSEQEDDGCWFGRWGVNYIYGTGAVLPALQAVGEDMGQPYVRRAVEWLLAHQNQDGGWGESCASYADPSLRGQGPSTASQTAWALMGLLAAGEAHHPAAQRGVRYLLDTQRPDGSWDEPYFTGSGFPGYGIGQRLRRAPKRDGIGLELPAGFMINYHLYRDYFPLMALGRYKALKEA